MGCALSQIIIYQDGDRQVDVRLEGETVWLSQRQMADVFDSSTDNIGLHLKNIYAEGELEERGTTEQSSVVQTEGTRQVTRRVKVYNLDAIISVAYRVNSKRGVHFRQWATRVLKEHLTRGFTLNRERFEANARELEAALELVRRTARASALDVDSGRGLIEIVSRYTQTFLWLQRYDEGMLTEPAGSPGTNLPPPQEVRAALRSLKSYLVERGEASDLFAHERGDGLDALLGNLEQSVFGEPAYPTLESKAAHLLYFVVKNHPFTDGNKRSGAYLFVDFLHRNGRLLDANGTAVINDTGLAALTLLVAESAPPQKDTLIRLIMNMIAPDNPPEAGISSTY